MLKFALIENSIVVRVTPCESVEIIQNFAGNWVDVTSQPQVGIGWIYLSGDSFQAPPKPDPIYRKDLTIAEWTNTFAPSEWEEAENAAYVVGSLINGEVVSAEIRQQWRQYLDGIKSNIPSVNPPLNAVIINAGEVEDYYTFLVAQSFITEERKTELQLGILTS